MRYVKGHHPKTVKFGRDHPLWAGGRVRNRQGYIVQTIHDDHPFASMGYRERKDSATLRVLEHRLVVAEHLGRPLESYEHVHHINGIRDDNRIENLQVLLIGQHAPGSRFVCLDCGSHHVAPAALAERG